MSNWEAVTARRRTNRTDDGTIAGVRGPDHAVAHIANQAFCQGRLAHSGRAHEGHDRRRHAVGQTPTNLGIRTLQGAVLEHGRVENDAAPRLPGPAAVPGSDSAGVLKAASRAEPHAGSAGTLTDGGNPPHPERPAGTAAPSRLRPDPAARSPPPDSVSHRRHA